ncbi:hypothetical protein EsH8_IV_000233 [Colletotrichum jinshuiense]
MEPAGFAVGVVGLAGLFKTCLEAVNVLQSYRSARSDADVQHTLFNAVKTRFQQWGRGVGIENGRLLDDHHPGLDDEAIAASVRDLLHFIIKFICDDIHASSRHSILGASSSDDHSQSRYSLSSEPKRRKLAWAFWGKGERTEKVNLFEKLVQELHNLVPPYSTQGLQQMHKPDTAVIDNHIDVLATSSSHGLSAELWQILTRIEGEIRAETRRDIHLWLDQRLPNERYQDSLQRRLAGTCDWILSQPAFIQWLSLESATNSKLLWINGPPGFGKTILCASIVEHLSTTLQTPVAYFFFSSDLESRNDPFSAMRSWISQIISNHNDAFDYVRQRWEADSSPIATRATSITIFTQLLDIVPGSIFVIDGLDECTSSDTSSNSVARFLHSVVDAMSGTNTRVLLVSRNEHRIHCALADSALDTFAIHKISPRDVRLDTEAVSKEIVNRKLPNKGDDVRSTISEAMTNRCDGQFLWLKMQEESLRKGMNKKQLQQTINNSPIGLNQVYDYSWTRITRYGELERLRAFAILRWAAFALRPLTVYEITEAALLDDLGDLQLEDLPDAVDEDYIETEIVGLCSPLLDIRNESLPTDQQTVHLAHFTVREYLLLNLPLPKWLQKNERLHASYEKMQNTFLSKACLYYINSDRVWKNSIVDPSLTLGISFRNYAATSWHRHIKLGLESDKTFLRIAVGFFSKMNSAWDAWRVFMESEFAKQEKTLAETNPPGPLYNAVRLHLTDLITILIQEGECDVNEASSWGRSALFYACWNGSVDIAAMLLRNGADATFADKDGRTPMYAASDQGHVEVVKLLLENGADITVESKNGWTPANIASQNGHIEVVKLLLENGADIAVTTNDGWTPVNIASEYGHIEVVKLLLENGADITVAEKDGWTPVNIASQNGHIEVVKLLLENGTDITVTTNNGWTPVNIASQNGYIEVVKLLLENGADITVATNDGWTPVNIASQNGHIEVVKLLLENGADITVATNDGWTPVNIASEYGHIEVVKLLLENGADITVTTNNGWTPVNIASQNGHIEVVKLLLENGADITVAEKDGWTPVNIASENGHIEVVKLLLKNGADITVITNDGWTPVNIASQNGHIEVVKLLLENGADITVAEKDGWTPVNIASQNGHIEVVKLLLENGADITVAEKDGWTPVNIASQNGHIEVVKLLLENGADITVAEKDGWKPVHITSQNGHIEVFKLLLDKGADVTAVTNSGFTPMHLASLRGHKEIVELLLATPAIDVDKMDNYSRTPLFFASRYGHTTSVQLLLADSRINPLSTDWFGSSPLFAAVRNGHLEVAEALIEHGASDSGINVQDGFRRTLQWWAHRTGNSKLVALLAKHSSWAGDTMHETAPTDTLSVIFNCEDVWCDACTLGIPEGCKIICDCDDFCLCGECLNMGIKCLDETHTMLPPPPQ